MTSNVNRLASKQAEETQPAGQTVSMEEKVDVDATKQEIIAALRNVYDPEISVNIYDLGLVYNIEIDREGHVQIQMTLTAPGCPVAGFIVQQVESAVRSATGVTGADVELVWDPPWGKEMMSEEAKLELGLY